VTIKIIARPIMIGVRGYSCSMVLIKAGDLVKSGGIEFHIKSRDGPKVEYWVSDTERIRVENRHEFMKRCYQRGNLIVEPGEGKFGDDEEWHGRERYVEVADWAEE